MVLPSAMRSSSVVVIDFALCPNSWAASSRPPSITSPRCLGPDSEAGREGVMAKAINETFERAVAEAVAHQRAGQLHAAEVAYREALRVSPGHPVATHNLG